MNKCTDCYWYPRSLFRQLFHLRPVYSEFAKCQNPNTGTPCGKQRYCEIERNSLFDRLEEHTCKSEGLLFVPWNKTSKTGSMF